MKNNKNLLRTEEKSQSELREIFPNASEEEINDLEHIEKAHRQEGQALKNTTTRS